MSTRCTKYDTKTAAEYLGVVPNTLCNWRNKRRGPVYHKVGDRVFYYEDDLKSFVDAGRVDPNAR